MIPKIIHQIWFGPKKRPDKFIYTWQALNPSWLHVMWDEARIAKEFPGGLANQRAFDQSDTWYGKSDIARYEILRRFGGVYVDCDAICVRGLGDSFTQHDSFAAYESETYRPGLVANGYLGAVQGCELMDILVRDIAALPSVSERETKTATWQLTGPGLLTRVYEQAPYPKLHVYPSYVFMPEHPAGPSPPRPEGAKIYAKQLWGSTRIMLGDADFYDKL